MNNRKILDNLREQGESLQRRIVLGEERGFSQQKLLPTFKVVLILSLLIFVVSILLEVNKHFSGNIQHSFLIHGVLIALSIWTLIETLLFKHKTKSNQARRLKITLSFQLLFILISAMVALIANQSKLPIYECTISSQDTYMSHIFFFMSHAIMFFWIADEVIAIHTKLINIAFETSSAIEKSAINLTDRLSIAICTLISTPGQVLPKLTLANETFIKISRNSREELSKDLGRLIDIVHPDDRNGPLQGALELFRNDKRFEGSLRILGEKGIMWVSIDLIPRADYTGIIIWDGMVVDITDRINTELVQKENLALQAKQEERSRLIEDVHDGFGSQLQTARLLIAHRELSQDQLLKLVDECVNDLHLVVDLLGSHEMTLTDALIDYRHRLQSRIKASQCRVQWDIRLQNCPKLPDRITLQLLRILQEAVNNSLIHSGACNVIVSASVLPNEILRLSIVDDGFGMPADPKKGRGLSNMLHRAKIIQAEIVYTANSPRGTGTTVELTLELARVCSDLMSKMNLEMQPVFTS